MKKLISMVLCISIIVTNLAVMAETTEIEGLHEKLNALILENNFTEEQISDMDKQFVEYFNRKWPGQLEGYKVLGKMKTDSDEEEYEYRLNEIRPNFSYGIRATLLSVGSKYAKSYADANSFKYLFSEDEFWLIPILVKYNLSGNLIENMEEIFNSVYDGILIYNENIEIIKNEEYIKGLLLKNNETTVENIKFFALTFTTPFLYIDCGKTEYLMPLYVDIEQGKYAETFEQYKLYPLKNVLRELTKRSSYWQEKSTFEAEALSLQEDGLLYGNENGLDLLKPLTRIEAVTMLLRAMGKTTACNSTSQTFSDVPVSHWGFGAAENAYSLGLIKGIGNNMFAPDDTVTGTQFAAMVLRAGNHAEFNWEEALDILVSEDIISADDTAAMDFFTRGDMAKIIYESIEKGVF